MGNRPVTPLLDRVQTPADLKSLSDRALRQRADALRAEVISAVSMTGGQLGAGLAVALHAVFDAPRDKIIWDVGHCHVPGRDIFGVKEIKVLGGGVDGLSRI